jgi:hypothetical protein
MIRIHPYRRPSPEGYSGHDLPSRPTRRRRRRSPCRACAGGVGNSMRLMVSSGVGWRSRLGRELRSCGPARPSCWKRSTHLRTVRGQTPAASLAACGVCPPRTILARCSRPNGVRRAFLWMSIRLSQEQLTSRQHQLPRSAPDGQPVESSLLESFRFMLKRIQHLRCRRCTLLG